MIKFLELHIRNFYSYGNNITIIPLSFTDPTLIIGENHDVMIDGEYDANAVGKSSILNALSYALYGKPVSPVKRIDDIINNINKKNLYVAVIFVTNGLYYKIERWRKNKKMGGTANNGLKITSADTLEGLDIKEQRTVETPAGREVDTHIPDKILHMPFDIFARIAVITVKYPPPFLSLRSTSTTEASQRSILEELFGQKELTEKGKILKEVIKETIAEIKRLTELNERIEEETGRYQEQLDFAQESISTWETTHKTEIADIKASINACDGIDYDAELAHLHAMDDVQEEIQRKQNRMEIRQVKLDDHAANVKNSEKWEVTNASTIQGTKQLLSPYKSIDFESELNNLNALEVLKEDHATEVSKQRTLTSDMDKLYEKIDTLNNEVTVLKSSKCPYCEQAYHGNEDKISEKEGELRSHALAYNKLQDDIEVSKSLGEDLIEQIDNVDCMFDNIVDYTNSKNQVAVLETKLADAENAANPYTDVMDVSEIDVITKEVATLKSEVDASLKTFSEMDEPPRTEAELHTLKASCTELKNRLVAKINEVNPHEEAVERLTKVFESIDEPRTTEIDELQVKLEHQQFLLKLLTKSDSYIRQALLDVNLPLLNARMRHYLDIIGLPHKVEFTKDMSISISQFNNEIGYNNLSGGQQARINLAIAFSFRDVVQARHQKINVCVLDECLDTGLSNLGVKVAAKMIKQVAEENELSMYVITHRDEIKSSFNRTLKAVLKGGLTTVEFNPPLLPAP